MMFIEAPQGTPAWYQARVGKITASCFADAVSRIGGLDERQQKYVTLVRGGADKAVAQAEAGYKVAPSSDLVRRALLGEETSEPSDTARRYAADLAIERISAAPHGEPIKTWVLERGHEMETKARMIYEARTGAFVTEAGICVSDDGIFGYSTDGLVDDDGLIEIKAPIDSIKIMEMWRTGDVSEYEHQMQGGMWITGRKYCDFIMYVPDLGAVGKDLFVKRIFRDDAFIDTLAQQLAAFDSLVLEYETILRDGAPVLVPLINEVTMEKTPEQSAHEFERSAATLALIEAEDELARIDGSIPTVQADPPISMGELLVSAPTLRLGQISERLGFTVTADFMLLLGFAPAATDKAAKLYHNSDFPNICAALIRHISAVAAK
jgi:hypothetical protein